MSSGGRRDMNKFKGQRRGGWQLLDQGRNLTVRLGQPDIDRLKTIAVDRNMKVSTLVRRAIHLYLQRLEHHPWYRSRKP